MLAGECVLFLYEDAFLLRWVEGLAREHSVTLRGMRRDIARLPAMQFAAQILRQTEAYGASLAPSARFEQEKGLWHYWRDFRAGGAQTYLQILTIWLSKVLLLEEVSGDNPFGSEQFAWVDASVARFNGERRNWNFVRAADSIRRIAHYGSRMRKLGQPLGLNASFLKGDRQAWRDLRPRYLEALNRAAVEAYPNDEETILDEVMQRDPALFSRLDDQPSVLA